jgi:hypothetical protein
MMVQSFTEISKGLWSKVAIPPTKEKAARAYGAVRLKMSLIKTIGTVTVYPHSRTFNAVYISLLLAQIGEELCRWQTMDQIQTAHSFSLPTPLNLI